MNKIEPPTELEYRKGERYLLVHFAPRIYPCKKCGWPVADGYCCGKCETTSPKTTLEEDEVYERK